MAASSAAQEAAQAAAEEKARLLTELQEVRLALDLAAAASDKAGNAPDDMAHELAMQLKEAHEALYELEMDALEASRVAQQTANMLDTDKDIADEPFPEVVRLLLLLRGVLCAHPYSSATSLCLTVTLFGLGSGVGMSIRHLLYTRLSHACKA